MQEVKITAYAEKSATLRNKFVVVLHDNFQLVVTFMFHHQQLTKGKISKLSNYHI